MSFMQEIEDALLYSKKLDRCLKQETNLEPLYADWDNEQRLHLDRTKRVIISVPMPPPMQALQYELNLLREKLGGVFHGPDGEKQINAIFVEIATIRALQGKWLEKEIEQRPKLVEELSRIDFGFDVGAKWRMNIFENLPEKKERVR